MFQRYRNRLWVRLSIASSFFVLTGILLVGLTGILLTRNDVYSAVLRERLQAKGALIDQLAEHYQLYQNWSNIENVTQTLQNPLNGPFGSIALVLADEGGQVFYDPYAGKLDQRLTSEELESALPVMVDGRVRGYVYLAYNVDSPAGLSENTQSYVFQQISRLLLLLAVVGGFLGILAGVTMSRGLTAPLNDLAALAREFGTKNFNKRAEVKGSEEILALATAFNNMANALQQAEILRRNLVSDVAHELRTPLTVLQANIQAILDGVYAANNDEIRKLLEQTELLSRLVNDLHELAQLEAKQLPLHTDTVDLVRLLGRTVKKFEAVAVSQQVNLKELLTPIDRLEFQGDPNRIQQVINNLIQNALTHTPAGGSISVELSKTNHQAFIMVKDNGSGISAEHLPHVFERFYRVDHARSRTSGGTGLGLAIAKAIAEAHGGTISVMSEGISGQGTTFTVSLPLETTQSTNSA